MKIAYLILAHTNPSQLHRLVSIISSDNVYVYINIDKKADLSLEYFKMARDIKNLFFIENRISINWGAFSMIQATLNGLNQMIEGGPAFDYINLLSGQDYPTKTKEEIYGFFEENYGREYISFTPFPTAELQNGGMDRIDYYYDLDTPTTSFSSSFFDIYAKEMKRLGMKRKYPDGMKPYHGSQWWSLTLDCVKYILKTVYESSEILRYYRHTKFPDEHFFQTIIMNSPFSENVINNDLRYVDWAGVDFVNSPHPKILTVNDFPVFTATDDLFARKFDETIDKAVLDMIDVHLLK